MVAYTYYPTDTRVRREAEALVDRGDTVDVISLGKKGKQKVQTLNEVRLIQLNVSRYRGSSAAMYIVNYLLFFIAASFWLAVLHFKNPYQIIQAHTMPDFMIFVAIIPKILGAKVVLDVHDLMPELYRSKFNLEETHWLIHFITWIERCSIGFAHKAIAVHKPHLDALIRHGNPEGKFIILLNLPDSKYFTNRTRLCSKNDSVFKLIYHGMVSRRHGLQVVLQAMSCLKEEIEGLKFQIIGEGDGVAYLTHLVEELDLTDKVNFSKGFVPLEELVPIILEADIGVVPILYDDFTRFMLPVKLLEYVAIGKPVICSRTETIQAYFDDSMVQFFSAGNDSELADNIRVLYRNPARREQLRRNSDKFNREYSWVQQKQLYYRLIDSLLNE